MTKQNGKMTNHPQVDKWVRQFLALRNKLREIDQKVEDFKAPFEEAKNKIAAEMMAFLDETNQEAARTQAGTVYLTVRHNASLSEPDAFMDFVIQNNAFELMDRRANATACRDYADNFGMLPPGVKLNSVRSVGVRSSGKPSKESENDE